MTFILPKEGSKITRKRDCPPKAFQHGLSMKDVNWKLLKSTLYLFDMPILK